MVVIVAVTVALQSLLVTALGITVVHSAGLLKGVMKVAL